MKREANFAHLLVALGGGARCYDIKSEPWVVFGEDYLRHTKCHLCKKYFNPGESACNSLEVHKFRHLTMKFMWDRNVAHTECVALNWPRERPLDIQELKRKTELSKWMYMLLLEAGLPGDLAWPITAVAIYVLPHTPARSST